MLKILAQFLKKILPKKWKNKVWLLGATYLDFKEDVVRRFPAPHRGFPLYGLSETQIYPEGENFDPQMINALKITGRGLNITKKTKLASLGSCFAEEFAYYMQTHDYNYLKYSGQKVTSSCDWRRVYTVNNFKQIVDYSLDEHSPLLVESSTEGWLDPYREYRRRTFPTYEESKAEIIRHRAESRRVFQEAEVLIFTLGQIEYWFDAKNKITWAARPPQSLMDTDPTRFQARISTYQENVAHLHSTLAKLLEFNSKLQIILTVSPVPCYGTFCSTDIVTQNFGNKCLLRVVAQEMIQALPDRVRYFPSFELVLAYNPYSLKSDNMHVKFKSVRRIFKTFENSFTDKAL